MCCLLCQIFYFVHVIIILSKVKKFFDGIDLHFIYDHNDANKLYSWINGDSRRLKTILTFTKIKEKKILKNTSTLLMFF